MAGAMTYPAFASIRTFLDAHVAANLAKSPPDMDEAAEFQEMLELVEAGQAEFQNLVETIVQLVWVAEVSNCPLPMDIGQRCLKIRKIAEEVCHRYSSEVDEVL